MYYGGVARGPTFHHQAVIFLALVLVSCKNDLYPLRFVPDPTSDSGVPGDASVPDVSVPVGDCPSGIMGFATVSDVGGEWDAGTTGMPQLQLDAGTTGGGPLDGGTTVVVDATDSDALARFSMYAGDKMPGPLTIVVKGMISIPPPLDGGSGDVQKIRVSSNKTVIGANVLSDPAKNGSGSGFTGGGLTLTDVSNVVLQNLVIAMPNSDDSTDNVDAVHIEGSHQIWIDHCDLSSNGPTMDAGASYDGLVDISDGSDFVTVSWTRYHDHAASGLIGRSDSSAAAAQDAGKDHVTFDHDWFNNVGNGPRIRFGTVHVLNCFFDQITDYGVASTDGASVVIEACNFQDVTEVQNNADYGPVTTLLDGATAGTLQFDPQANVFTSSGQPFLTTANATVPLPYKDQYIPDSPKSVPALVQACGGTGKIAAPTGN